MAISRSKTSNKCVLADGGHTNAACCVMYSKGLGSICSLAGVGSRSVLVSYAAAHVPDVSSVLNTYAASFAV